MQAGYPAPSSLPRCLENPDGFPRAETAAVLLNTQQQLLDAYQTHLHLGRFSLARMAAWGPCPEIFPSPGAIGEHGAGQCQQQKASRAQLAAAPWDGSSLLQ